MNIKLEGISAKKCLIYTVIYITLVVGLLVVNQLVGVPLGLKDVGDYFTGLAAPLAIFWLVFGCFQQSKEVRLSSEALKAQAQELKKSVDEMKSSENNQKDAIKKNDDDSRKITFLKFQELLLKKLNSNTKMLAKFMCGGTKEYNNVVRDSKAGNKYAYYYLIKSLIAKDDMSLSNWSQEGKVLPYIINAAEEYCHTYNSLIEEARKADVGSHSFEAFFQRSVMADVYNILINDPDMQATEYCRKLNKNESIAA